MLLLRVAELSCSFDASEDPWLALADPCAYDEEKDALAAAFIAWAFSDSSF